MKIGLLGATIYNPNLGCQALAWSILIFLQNVSRRMGCEFEYVVFDRILDEKTFNDFLNICPIDKEKIKVTYAGTIKFYKISRNANFLKEIKKCDVIIDITQGDSFSDIYGLIQYWRYALEKIAVLSSDIPLVLGPQTYGPFSHKIVSNNAKRIGKRSFFIVARDEVSCAYYSKLCSKSVFNGIDLAFILPFQHTNENIQTKSERTLVGVNPSGMLWKQNNAPGNAQVSFKANYREYIIGMVSWLEENGYKVILLSHVLEDEEAAKEIQRLFPKTELVPFFSNCVEAKNKISQLDCLIGSRMHATIAGISSKTPVIPVSYSRKFEGLYKSIEYNHVVSLRNLTTDEAITATIQEIKNLDLLVTDTAQAESIITRKIDEMEDFFAVNLNKLIGVKK